MKVNDIKKNLDEATFKKIKESEDSHFEGHSFVTHGKDITTVDIDMPLVLIDKLSVVIKWSGKLDLHNDGVYGLAISVKSMTANSEEEERSDVPSSPLNFNGFEFVVKKIKNPDMPDIQAFITDVFVSTKERKVYVEFAL